jgi:anti-anti-sigma regulatory factor
VAAPVHPQAPSAEGSDEPVRVPLPEALDLKGVRVLKAELGAALDGGRPIVVDAGKVAKVSTASLQILAAFFAAAANAGRPATLDGATAPLEAAVHDLDLAAFFPRLSPTGSSCAS